MENTHHTVEPLLVDIMRDYVDARGMGIRRKIVPLVRQQSGRDALFDATDDFVKLTLPRADPSSGQ